MEDEGFLLDLNYAVLSDVIPYNYIELSKTHIGCFLWSQHKDVLWPPMMFCRLL